MHRFVKLATALSVAMLIYSCGGGGGENVSPGGSAKKVGVFTGFSGDLDWEIQTGGEGEGDGVGEGADGDGGIGAGGSLGQFRGALVKVFFPDGTSVGEALTDDVRGMVTIKPGREYTGALLIEIHGQTGASYFEEGKNEYVPFPEGKVLHAIIARATRNVGITPFSEAGYQLALRCQNSLGPQTLCGQGLGQSNQTMPGDAAIASANEHVRDVLNQQFPSSLHIDDVTRLPFIVNDNTSSDSVDTGQRGRYGLVNVAFSKQAAMYNTDNAAPTLLATQQLSNDLLDGRLDGQMGDLPAADASSRTYDPHTFTSELSSALAQQTHRIGKNDALASLPAIVAFGNVRYDSYLFDTRIVPSGSASTIAVATETNSTERTAGQVTEHLQAQGDNRGFMVYGNMGSGSLYIKTDSSDSTSQTLVLGDNRNGELGNGSETATQTGPVSVTLPGVLTHAVGGFGHTLTRFADGSVYAVGDNTYGQLGLGQTSQDLPRVTTPRRVTLPAGALSVAATNDASFALLENGRVYSWGSAGGFGALGNGTASGERNSPASVSSTTGELGDVVQLSARDQDAIVLTADGSVLTWGSFNQSATGSAPTGIQPGRTVATKITGLPDADIRKVITEQGLFAVLIGSGTQAGAVYAWGHHFDITANQFLNDVQPRRVLNLPPVRDLMPGGFIGYGQRPSDRLTAMAIDYSGRLWKIRGRVAERYDPTDPTAQRRPPGQAPRVECDACHTVRTAIDPLPLTSGPTCVLPQFKLNASGDPVLVNSKSDCGSCHNGGTLGDGSVLAPLTCVPPTLPPPTTPINATPLTNQCALPTGHTSVANGVYCASCHNSVIASALSCSPDLPPIPPPSATTVMILDALDDVGPIQGALSSGQSTDDTSPVLRGTTSASLITGEAVRVLRNLVDVGAATHDGGTGWTFNVPTLPDANHSFTARVKNAGGAAGVSSSAFSLIVATGSVQKTAAISTVEDDVSPQSGSVANGASTNDSSPRLSGTISAPLLAGESISLARDNVEIRVLAPIGQSTWSHIDSGLTNSNAGGTDYQYTVTVISATGARGTTSSAHTIRFDNQTPPTPAIESVTANSPVSSQFNILVGAINNGRGTHDNSPTITARVIGAATGDRINLYNNGNLITSSSLAVVNERAQFTHSTGINLNPDTAPESTTSLLYSARAVDAAGNISAASSGHAVNVGFFDCDVLRNNFPAEHQTQGASCANCHDVKAASARVFVPAPPTESYWCSRAGQNDIVPLPR